MKKILFFILFINFSFALGQQQTPNTYAIIIGDSKFKYANYKIKYADSDAQMIYDFFRSKNAGNVPKKNLVLLINEDITRPKVISLMNKKLNEAHEADFVVIYIATKGLSESGEVFFACYDTDPKNVIATALSQKDIEKALLKTKAKNKLWIIDASYSGGAGDKVTIKNDVVYDEYLREYDKKIQCAIFSASNVNEFSKEGIRWGGGHGAFSYHFIEGLKGKADLDHDDAITIKEIYEYVYQKIVKDTDSHQHPQLKGEINNDFIISNLK